MKRGSLKLGHNRQIMPVNPRFAGDGQGNDLWGETPFLQRIDDPNVESNINIGAGGVTLDQELEGADDVLVNASRRDDVDKWAKCCEGVESGTSPTCPEVNCDRLPDDQFDRCSEYEACADGSTPVWNEATQTCDCAEGGGDDQMHQESFSRSYEGRDTNILTPHQARRNQRMINVIGRSSERKRAAANRRVRRAIRRGMEPGAEDLAILSGATDSDLSVFNLAEDSPHTRNMMGVNLGQHNQGTSGRPLNADEYKALESKLINEGGYTAGSPELYDAMAAADVGQMPRNIDIEAGKYMDNRTRRLYEKHGFGDGSTTSNRTRRLQGKLNRKGISEKKKKRLEKRIKNRAKRGK